VTVRRRLAALAAAGALLAAPAEAAGQQADPTRFRDPTLPRRSDSALPRAAVAARQTWVRGTQMGEQARELAAQRAAAELGTAAALGPANVEPGEHARDLGEPVASGPPPFVHRGACARETRMRVAVFVSWLRTLPGGDALAAVIAERAADARC
jgi:hypothetical protein